jgi:hypothetical protein
VVREQFAKRVIGEPKYGHFSLEWLYKQQTPGEQARNVTLDLNGVGFTGPDAPILSGLALKVLSGGTLTTPEETILKRKLPKYWRQFTYTRLINPPGRKPPRSFTWTTSAVKNEAA